MKNTCLLLTCLLLHACFHGSYIPSGAEYKELEKDLFILDNAEEAMRNRTGSFGDLPALSAVASVASVGTRLNENGYLLRVEVQPNSYHVYIRPKVFHGNTHVLSVYSDETKKWRHGWGESDIAGPKSRPIKLGEQ